MDVRQAIVTLGTDGLRDYIQMSDGQRLLLGAVTVLKFVTEATPLRFARQVLDAFNSTGTAIVTVDLDAMEKLLKPHVARWSSEAVTDPLIHRANRTPTSTRVQIMSDTKNLLERLGKIEGVVTLLDKRAQESLIAPKLHEELRGLVGSLHFTDPGDQSKNDAWYVKGEPKVDTADASQKLPASATVGGAAGVKVEEAGKASTTPVNAPAPSTTPVYAPGTKSASEVAPTNVPSYENLKSNTVLAEQVLDTVETTNQKIETLVTAGRKFNASKAKSDLYAIASKTTEILNNVDLAQPWVRNDLSALASEATRIHDLFASAKV